MKTVFKERTLITTDKVGFILFPNQEENDILFGVSITTKLPGTLLCIGLGFAILYIAIGDE